MNTIILYSEKKDIKIKGVLIQALKNSFQLNVFDFNEAYSVGEGDCINIIQTNSLKNINIKNCVVILTSNAKLYNIKHIDKSCAVIINSDNIKGISRLSKQGVNIFTCGFSAKDYITFSSRDEDVAVVSLQRPIELSKSKYCEPFEIPCQINHNLNDFAILASVLTLIMLEEITEIKCSMMSRYTLLN